MEGDGWMGGVLRGAWILVERLRDHGLLVMYRSAKGEKEEVEVRFKIGVRGDRRGA